MGQGRRAVPEARPPVSPHTPALWPHTAKFRLIPTFLSLPSSSHHHPLFPLLSLILSLCHPFRPSHRSFVSSTSSPPTTFLPAKPLTFFTVFSILSHLPTSGHYSPTAIFPTVFLFSLPDIRWGPVNKVRTLAHKQGFFCFEVPDES